MSGGRDAGIVEVMDIDTKALLAVLSHMHPAWEPRVLDSRVKYFMRQGWPSPAVTAGRGLKVRLGVDDVMRFVLVHELLDAMVPPGPAAAMIDASWTDLRAALAGVWRERGTRTAALPILVRMRSVDADDGDGGGTAVAATGDDVRRWLGGHGGSRRLLVLDAMRLIRGFGAAVVDTMAPQLARSFVAAVDEWVVAS